MDSEDYGSLVKNLRQKSGLTQSQVADSLGVTPGYISNVENNRTAMSLRILTYYARLVGCSLDSLVGELEPEGVTTILEVSAHANPVPEPCQKGTSSALGNLTNSLW